MPNTTEKKAKILISLFCILVSCSSAEGASPKRDVREGNIRYEQGDYAASREKYLKALEKDPESEIINFNLGTAFYKEEDYDQSVSHLQKVLLSDNEDLKENAHYNLGNVLYQLGMTRVGEDINAAVSSLENSLNQYKSALSINQEDKDAKHNYDYVQKELLRLKEMQKQQQQDQKQSKEKNEQQQQQDQQSQKEQQDQQDQQEAQKQQQQGQQGESGEEEQDRSEQGERQGQQEKSDQERGQAGKEDYNKQQETGTQSPDAQELTQKEAQMLLEGYQQTEEPQGMLKVYPRADDMRPVIKDW